LEKRARSRLTVGARVVATGAALTGCGADEGSGSPSGNSSFDLTVGSVDFEGMHRMASVLDLELDQSGSLDRGVWGSIG
jgi:hypothetical protein